MLIHVIIYNGDSSSRCGVNCGMNLSALQEKEFVRDRLRQRYGDDVKIDFVDVAHNRDEAAYREIIERIEKEDLLLPLVVINGRPRLSGSIEYMTLVDAIDAQIDFGR